MLRVTLDTNLFVSAFIFSGKPDLILQMALDGVIEVAISQAIIDETARILQQKFGRTESEIGNAINIMKSLLPFVTPSEMLTVVTADPDDNRLVECAMESGSVAIVTGDRYLLRMEHYKGIKMLRVSQFFYLIDLLADT